MKGKKLLSLFFGLMLALGLTTTALAAEKGDIVILYTNDVHCQVDQKPDKETSEVTNIGYAGVAAYKNDLEDQLGDENVLLVDAGDAIQGDTIGTLSKGKYLVDIMNFLGYDCATYGNHEFDYGMAQALKLNEIAVYPYLSCNFTDLRIQELVSAPYALFEAQGHMIAFVGVSTPTTYTSSCPAYFQDEDGNYIYGFREGNDGQDLYDAVQTAIDAAKADGADIIIALGHLGDVDGLDPWRSKDVIANVSGLDAFIDGHAHSTIPGEILQDKDGKDVVLTSTGTKLQNLGQLTISPDGSISVDLIAAKDCTEQDPEALEFISEIEDEYEELVNTVVATSDVDLTTLDPVTGQRAIRNAETNLGDLCADAYRTVSGADIAFVNGGGIRADIAAGDITYGDIIKVHPFGNTLCVVEATGQEILDALELGARLTPEEDGGFLQVSGLLYTIDTTMESTVTLDEKSSFTGVAGQRRVKDVYVLQDGEYVPIDPEATYTLASHNYLLKNGGNGFTMFQDNPLLQDEVMIDNQVLITYIQDYLGGVIGEEYASLWGEGRICRLIPPFEDVTDTSAYYFKPVQFLSELGIVNGVSDGIFAPEETISRGMMVTMLYRLVSYYPDQFNGADSYDLPGCRYFDDVEEDSYYDEAIGWAYENGVVFGYPDDTFRPDAPITREEIAMMLFRIRELTVSTIDEDFRVEDVDLSLVFAAEDWYMVSPWAYESVAWALDNDILRGTDPDALVIAPKALTTRAQAATMFYRTLFVLA